jgi:endonuclease-3
MDPGTYTLLVALEQPTTVQFGAAGDRSLESGYYAYTGSAFGPGGLSRVQRHRRVAEGSNETRQWHVDYLLGADPSRLVDLRTAAHRKIECEVATRLDAEPIPGIGASDCGCDTHLHYRRSRDGLERAIDAAYE